MTQDPLKLARRTILFLWLWLAADVALALTCFHEISLLHGMDDDQAAYWIAQTQDGPLTPSEIASVVYTAVSLISGGLMFRWFYVVNRNAHAWSDAMSVSSWGNVLWFVVPVANLWKPYQGVRESWAVSVDPGGPVDAPAPGWMRGWWTLWIATSMLGNIGFRLSLHANTRATLTTVDWLFVASIAIDVPLVILARRVVAEMSARQTARLADAGSVAA